MKAGRLIASLFPLLPIAGFGQLVVDQTMTPAQLVQNVLLGSGVSVSNITFNGQPGGTTLNDQIARFDGTASNIGMTGGVLLASGNASMALGPNNSGSFSIAPANAYAAGDPDLQAIVGASAMYNPAILEFDFIPNGDTLKFNYVFASEEYNEYACTGFNDSFGFFMSGPGLFGPYTNNAVNVALIPGTTTPVAINTVNIGVPGTAGGTAATCLAANPLWPASNVYFTDNTGGTTVQFDGFTTVLTATVIVQCGQT